MNLLIVAAFLVVCAVTTESRYPYEDSYRGGDVVPYANERRHQRGGGGYPIQGIRGGQRPVQRGHYDDYAREVPYNRRRPKNYLRPRGLGGYKNNYDDYDYEYGRYRRPYSRINNQRHYSSNDDFGYSDLRDA